MNEVKIFILNNKGDIMLTSETYQKSLFENTILFNIPYTNIPTHPDGIAHGDTAIIGILLKTTYNVMN